MTGTTPSACRPDAPRRPSRLAGTVMLVGTALAGCGWGDPGGAGGSEEETTIRVLAASSLTDAFEELAEVFEDEHPDVDVALSFGSSTDLAEQAADGAPGDVVATADQASMQVVEDAGAATGAQAFASNVLVVVVPPGNPDGIASLDDLDGATWVRCADEVPCGRVALAVLEDSGIDADPASLEEDARSTLDKVVSGEADAALVYASDAAAAGDTVTAIDIPGAEQRLTSYFLAPLAQSAEPDLAQELIDLVTGDEGRRVLRDAGFGLP